MRPQLPKTRPENFRLNLASPLAQGLVFAGLGHSGGPGHSLLMDSSLYGNHGTLTNMDPATDWVWVPELGRWAINFNGINEHISCGNPVNLLFVGQSFSGTCWIRQSTSDIFATIFGNGLNGPGWGFTTYTDGSGNLLFYSDATFATSDVSVLPSVGTWCCVGYDYIYTGANNNSISFYLNGASCGTAGSLQNITAASGNFRIGVDPRFGSGLNFLGDIADSCVFLGVLGANQHAAFADRSNVMLELGGVPLIQHRRTWWPVAVTGNRRRRFFLAAA